MKKILTILFGFSALYTYGQVKLGKPNPNQQLTTTVNLNVSQMASALNAGKGGKAIETKPLTITKLNQLDFAKMDADNLNAFLNGKEGPRSFGIMYWSEPVLEVYNTEIKPNVASFLSSFYDDHFQGGDQKAYIKECLTTALVNKARERGAYYTPGSEAKFREAIQKEFIGEQFPLTGDPSSVMPGYFSGRLINIFNATKIYLTSCPATMNKTTCHDDYSSSFFFLADPATALMCGNTVFFAYNKITNDISNSSLYQKLRQVEKGTLFKPLISFHGQNTFDILTVRQNFLQSQTKNNYLSTFYDSNCQCPSRLAYSAWGATRIRSASVNNP